MSVAQQSPIIVKLVEPKEDRTGLARVVFEAIGLTGVIALIAVTLGIVLAAVMYWVRRPGA